MPNDASVSAFVGYKKILAFVFTGEDGDKFSLKVGILGNPPLYLSYFFSYLSTAMFTGLYVHLYFVCVIFLAINIHN